MLEQLKGKRLELSNKISALLSIATAANRGLTEEEKSQHDALEREFDEANATIERLEKQAQREQKLSKSNVPFDIQVVREANHDEEGNYRGYSEFSKGGFGEYLRDVQRQANTQKFSDKLSGLQKWAAAGANQSVGADGGFLVQPDHVEELFRQTVAKAVLAPRCRRVQTSKGSVVLNLLDETSRATGSRFGGVQAYRLAEAGSITASRLKFAREEIKADALAALFYATDELLEDVPGLNSLVAPMFAEELAWKLDDEIVGGTGSGGQCLGILNAPATISIAKEGGQTADTVNYTNIDKMIDRVLPASEGRAEWFYHPDVRRQLRGMVFTPGSKTDFLPFVAKGSSVFAEKFDTLGGYPGQRIEQARALGDLGDIMLLDLSQYLLVERRGIAAAQSAHVKFLTSEMTFKWTMRVGGQPLLRSAITDAYGSTTRSAFVVLAERA